MKNEIKIIFILIVIKIAIKYNVLSTLIFSLNLPHTLYRIIFEFDRFQMQDCNTVDWNLLLLISSPMENGNAYICRGLPVTESAK